jgi:hypothetical protein
MGVARISGEIGLAGSHEAPWAAAVLFLAGSVKFGCFSTFIAPETPAFWRVDWPAGLSYSFEDLRHLVKTTGHFLSKRAGLHSPPPVSAGDGRSVHAGFAAEA